MAQRLARDRGTTDKPLIHARIGDQFDSIVSRFGDRQALVDVPSGRRWTYDALGDDVAVLTKGLLAKGIRPGDRVGLWAPNTPEWVAVWFAVVKAGAICVPVNPEYRTNELLLVVQQSGMRMLIGVPTYKTWDFCSIVDDVADECEDLEYAVFIGTLGWDDLLAAGRAAGPLPEPQRLPDDPACILYTSGTTGSRGKGVTLSHTNVANNARFQAELLGYTEHDRACVPVQFGNGMGLIIGILGTMLAGACLVIPESTFDPLATMHAVAAEKSTVIIGFPSTFRRLLEDPDRPNYDMSNLRAGMVAGAPCEADLVKRCIEELGIGELAQSYGLTETSAAVTQTVSTDGVRARTETVGRVHPHVEISLLEPASGRVVERGSVGEVCVRGYSVMLGYWDDAELTADSLREGCLHTGDLAVMDDDGYVQLVGRLDDVINRGDEKVSPWEVEAVIAGHPDVAEVQVCGVPDDRYGEAVCAWIRMREGAHRLTARSVALFCDGKLAYYKVPAHVVCVDEFPRTPTGKVRKVEMRATSRRLLGS